MKLFIAVLAIFALGNQAEAMEQISIQGTIAEAEVAEFDPFVIGDACVVVVTTEAAKNIALLTGYDDCAANGVELRIGRGVTVVMEESERIRNSDMLSILAKRFGADEYFQVDFGAIENGLADD